MKPPVPYYGGKQTLADRIVSLLPDHTHYVEPYCGSLAVLLAKRPSLIETVNDLDHELVTFWRVLRDRPADLVRACALTPHSRVEHQAALELAGDDLEVARRVWVRLTQGRAARLNKTGWRHFVIRNTLSMPGYLDAFQRNLIPAAERLSGVSLECRPALDLIRQYGVEPTTLIYADPPYLAETRNCTNYRHEMPHEAEHRELSAVLRECRSAVVLSGYPSDLYDVELYPGWHRHEIAAQTTQGGAAKATTEVLWSNRPLDAPAVLFEVVS